MKLDVCLICLLVLRKNARKPRPTKTAYIYTKKLYLESRYILDMIYNTILRFEDSGYYYCYCDVILGCERTHGFRANRTGLYGYEILLFQ